MVKVTLVSFTKDGERVVAVASKMSRSRKGWDYHWQNYERRRGRNVD